MRILGIGKKQLHQMSIEELERQLNDVSLVYQKIENGLERCASTIDSLRLAGVGKTPSRKAKAARSMVQQRNNQLRLSNRLDLVDRRKRNVENILDTKKDEEITTTAGGDFDAGAAIKEIDQVAAEIKRFEEESDKLDDAATYNDAIDVKAQETPEFREALAQIEEEENRASGN
jgi:hypothetical protein